MKRLVMSGLAALLLSGPALAAEPLPVTMTGGFQAVAHRTIATGAEREAMVYSVLGALTLAWNGAAPRPFSAECLGFDEQGGGAATTGLGRCVWKEAGGDSLFVSIATEGDRNVYRITGGTGKWAQAQGELRTSFTYLPAPEGSFLLSESGSGRLSAPKK